MIGRRPGLVLLSAAVSIAPAATRGRASARCYSRAMSPQHPRFEVEVSLDPDPVIEAYKKDIDRTLIRENLKLTPEERLNRLVKFQEFAEELRAAGRRARRR